MKRLLKSGLLILSALFAFQMTEVSAKAETVVDYDTDAAVSYAKEHWDDSSTNVGDKPDCIQFVRECMEAGGVPTDENRVTDGVPYGYTVEGYISYLVDNGYASVESLTREKQEWETPQWYVRAADNASVLTVGDGILYKCSACGAYFHASMFTGVSEEGFAEYYAQNTAVEGEELCSIDCSNCDEPRENVELYSLHITSSENGYDDHYNDAVITGLTAALNEEGNVRISWDALDGADGYKVFKKNGKTSAYNYIGESTEAYLDYSSEELTEGKAYYFAVRPYCVVDGKTYVGAMCDMYTYKYVIAVTGKLETPVIKATTDDATGKPVISWEAVSGADKYYVYCAKSKTGTYFKFKPVTTLQIKNSRAEVGVTYYYKVVAASDNENTENSDESNIVKVTCDLAQPEIKVTNVSSTGKPKISWDEVDGADKYYVYRATSKNGTYKRLIKTTKSYYTHSSALAGSTYYYKVKAVYTDNTSANSAYSEIVSRACDLAKPKVSITTSSSGKPKLSWDKVTCSDKYKVKYQIYRATSKNGTYTKIYTTSKTSYTHTGAKSGKTYYYKVKAVAAYKTSGNIKTSASSTYSTVVSKKCK